MRRKILYTFLTVVILLMLGVGVVWHLLGDETFMKRQVASAVEKATGRQLTIVGKFDLSLGSETTLVAEQIQFANPGWSTKPDMVDVRQLTLSFDLWSLLNGPLLVHLVDVSGCQVNLEQNTKGQANWDFSKKGDEKPKLHEADKARSEFLVLKKVELDECVLIHQAPDREEPLKAEVGQLALNWLQTGKYEVYAKGKVDTYDMSLSGDMGPFRSFWEGGPFEQNVKLNVGDISLDSSGSFSDVKTGTGANVKVQFSGPEFAKVTEFLALPPFSSDAFDFKLHINTSGDTTVLVVDGDLGSFDITANGEVDKLVQPYTGHLDTTAKGPDLRALGELFEIEGLVEESFEIELELKLKQGQLDVTALALDTGKDRIEVTGDAGSWPGFHGASIKFDISTEDYGRWEPLLSRQPKPAGPLSASGQVDSSDAGAVSITAQLTQQGNELSLDGSLGNLPLPDQPDLNFNLSAQSFQALGAVFDQTAWPEAAFKAKGRASRNEQGVVLEKVTASLADNEAELDGILILAEDFEGSNFELTLDIPSTTAFGELMGYAKLPDQPLRLSANVKPVGKGLKFSVKDGSLRGIKVKLDGEIPDVHHPALFSADADVRMPSLGLLGFLVPGTRLPDLPVAINGRVSHESGNAQLSDIHLEIGKSVADLSGNLNVSNGLVGSKLSVNASGSDFTEFLPAEAWNSLPGDFKVSGQWSKAADNEYLENIRIQVGKMTVEVSGTSDNMFKPQMARLKLKADFPDASMFNALFDWTLAPQPFLLNTDLAGSLTDFDLTNLAASLGQSNLTGELKIVRNEDVNVSGSLKSEFLDLGQWLKDKEQLKKADGTTDSAPKTRVFDDSPVMKFDAGNTDLDLDIQIAKADMGNTVFENIHLGVLVTDKRLKLDPFDFMGQQGSHVDGSFSLDGRGPVPELEITAHGQDLRLGLMAYEGQDPSTFPPFEISATIKGAGATQQALVSDLDGKIRIYQGSGVVASSGVEFLFSDFITQLFSMLNPFAKQNKETQIECGVLAADIVDGQVSIKPIVVQTSDITILSEGQINLVDEKIDLTFNTKPRTGLGISASALVNPFIKVGGTLAAPAIQLDAANAVISSSAAVATVGLSVLAKSLTSRWFSSNDPCGNARKKLEESDAN